MILGTIAVRDPDLVRSIIADKVSAVTNAQAITAALFQAARHGEGAHVQMNMMEANLGFFWGDLMMHCSLLDDNVQHQPNIMQSYRLHECKDGWVSIGVGTNDQCDISLSLATIYNTLEAFCQAGLAQRLPTPNGCCRYDATLENHLHVRYRESDGEAPTRFLLGRVPSL